MGANEGDIHFAQFVPAGRNKTEGKREAAGDGEDWKGDKEDVSEKRKSKRKSPQARTDTGCRGQ